MISVSEIDLTKNSSRFFIDSLSAVELRNMLQQHAGAEVSIFGIMHSASLAALAPDVAGKSSHVKWNKLKA